MLKNGPRSGARCATTTVVSLKDEWKHDNEREKNSSGSHQQTLLIKMRADEVKGEPVSYTSASIWEKANRKERKRKAHGYWSDDDARSEASDWPIPIAGRKREDKPLETLFALLSFLLSWNRSERAATGSLPVTTACFSSNATKRQLKSMTTGASWVGFARVGLQMSPIRMPGEVDEKELCLGSDTI